MNGCLWCGSRSDVLLVHAHTFDREIMIVLVKSFGSYGVADRITMWFTWSWLTTTIKQWVETNKAWRKKKTCRQIAAQTLNYRTQQTTWQRCGVCGQVYILIKVYEAPVRLGVGIWSRSPGVWGNQVTGKKESLQSTNLFSRWKAVFIFQP